MEGIYQLFVKIPSSEQKATFWKEKDGLIWRVFLQIIDKCLPHIIILQQILGIYWNENYSKKDVEGLPSL